ncbi:creatininase family protein, partial [Comamonas sp. C24C]
MMAMSNTQTTPASALPRWPSRFWAQASAHDFALAQNNGLAADTVAVLPVAAVEQHGPHLPLSVDASLIEGVIDAALAQLPA